MSDVFPKFWRLGSYKYPMYRSKFHTLFELSLEKSSLILDAGCGDKGGYILATPIEVLGIGLDIDRKNMKKAAERSKELKLDNLSFLVGDLEKMPFRKNIFDVVVCCDVLEHVKNPEKAIRELAFSVKKGGELLICTTNAFNPAMFVDGVLPKHVSSVIVRKSGAFHYERVYRLNPWNFVRKLNRYGLKVEKFLMFGYPPFGQPWIYHYSKTKPPAIFSLWILFDKLTNAGFLKNFKEEILVVAKSPTD